MKLIIDIDEYSFLSCKRWLKEGVAQWSEAIIANGTPIKTVTNAEEAEAYPINQEDKSRILRDVANIKVGYRKGQTAKELEEEIDRYYEENGYER